MRTVAIANGARSARGRIAVSARPLVAPRLSKDFARRDKLAFSLSSWPATRVSPNASGTSTSGSVFYSNRRARQKGTCDCWKNILMILNATRSSLVKWGGLNSWIPGIGVRSSMRCRMKTQRKRTTVKSATQAAVANAKLAAALSGDSLTEIGMTIAYLKRALKAITVSMDAAAQLRKVAGLVTRAQYAVLRQ